MKFTGEVTRDLTTIREIRERTKSSSPEMMKYKKRSAQKYRAFLSRRFDRFSRGGGNWKQVKRNKGPRRDRRRKRFILRVTHTLFKALSPVFRNLPGQWERITGDSIEVGYGGNAKHPSSKTKTVAQIAGYHQAGGGNLPIRQLVVQAASRLRKTLISDLRKMILKDG